MILAPLVLPGQC